MYMLIRLPNGELLKAVVLAKTRALMRLAAVGADDVVELRLRGSDWLDEGNEPVQFEFTGLLGSGFSCQRMTEDATREDYRGQQLAARAGSASIC